MLPTSLRNTLALRPTEINYFSFLSFFLSRRRRVEWAIPRVIRFGRRGCNLQHACVSHACATMQVSGFARGVMKGFHDVGRQCKTVNNGHRLADVDTLYIHRIRSNVGTKRWRIYLTRIAGLEGCATCQRDQFGLLWAKFPQNIRYYCRESCTSRLLHRKYAAVPLCVIVSFGMRGRNAFKLPPRSASIPAVLLSPTFLI